MFSLPFPCKGIEKKIGKNRVSSPIEPYMKVTPSPKVTGCRAYAHLFTIPSPYITLAGRYGGVVDPPERTWLILTAASRGETRRASSRVPPESVR